MSFPQVEFLCDYLVFDPLLDYIPHIAYIPTRFAFTIDFRYSALRLCILYIELVHTLHDTVPFVLYRLIHFTPHIIYI